MKRLIIVGCLVTLAAVFFIIGVPQIGQPVQHANDCYNCGSVPPNGGGVMVILGGFILLAAGGVWMVMSEAQEVKPSSSLESYDIFSGGKTMWRFFGWLCLVVGGCMFVGGVCAWAGDVGVRNAVAIWGMVLVASGGVMLLFVKMGGTESIPLASPNREVVGHVGTIPVISEGGGSGWEEDEEV